MGRRHADHSPDKVRLALAASDHLVPAITPRMHRRDLDGTILPRVVAPPPGKQAKQAAVMLLLYSIQGELNIVFTRRTDHLPLHAGQISFPGGGVKSNDESHLHTALREAEEELGIDVTGLELYAKLKSIYVPPSNYLIDPFVMYAKERPVFRPCAEEVAEVFEIPIVALMEPDSFSTEIRELAGGPVYEPCFTHQAVRIWGATAIILDQFISRIRSGDAAGS